MLSPQICYPLLTFAAQFVHKPNLAEYIRICSHLPEQARREAHLMKSEVRADWSRVSLQIVSAKLTAHLITRSISIQMDAVLWHKFNQHPMLKKELLSTGDAELRQVCSL